MNEILKMLENGVEVNLTIKSNDLLEFATFLVDRTKADLESVIQEDKQEVYLSPKEVCDFLNISPTTLWRWEKIGYLESLRIGGKKKYPKSIIKQRFTKKAINNH